MNDQTKTHAPSIKPTVLLFVASALLTACAAEEPSIATGDEQYSTDVTTGLKQELTAKYGLRPRVYNGFFNSSNEAEQRFAAHLPKVTAELNETILANGYDFTVSQADLATNFISEGGYYLLEWDLADTDPDAGEYIQGFEHLGVDTFADNLDALSPWLTEGLIEGIANEDIGQYSAVNELGQIVNTVVVGTIEQGLEANAVVYAWSRSVLDEDLADMGMPRVRDVDYEAAFYWTTVYFNAGIGFGQNTLEEEGIDYWTVKWTNPDNPGKYSGYARYNALWRTATYEFMDRTVLADR